jgi:hypothetical protein
MASQSVFSKGIFHSLPDLSKHDGKKYSAIVTGANGITGSHLIKILADASQRWGTVYALSRRVPSDPVAGNVKYLAIDFLSSPEEIASVLVENRVKAYVSPLIRFDVFFSPTHQIFEARSLHSKH